MTSGIALDVPLKISLWFTFKWFPRANYGAFCVADILEGFISEDKMSPWGSIEHPDSRAIFSTWPWASHFTHILQFYLKSSKHPNDKSFVKNKGVNWH